MKSYISHPIGGNTDLLRYKNHTTVDDWKRRMIPHRPLQIRVFEPIDYRGFDTPAYLRRLTGLLRLKADLEKLQDELEGLKVCRKQAD